MNKKSGASGITTSQAPTPVGGYPHARRAGKLLFLSGIGPRRPGTNHIPGNVYGEHGQVLDYDIEAQCHSLFDNVRNVLEAAGAGWDDLVDITVFLTDMERDFAAFNRLYGEYFKHNQPCRTTLEVKALPTAIAIELKCIACLED